MSKINSVVLCVALVLPILLSACAAPLAIQALSLLSGASGQSAPFSLDALGKQLGLVTKTDVAQVPQ